MPGGNSGQDDRGNAATSSCLRCRLSRDANRNFQTVRLEGKRAANSPAATVHLYDAHYSDLTKPQSTILSFFFAFYQLLFHLASLSLQAVYWVEAENVQADKKKIWRWRIVSSVHANSVRWLIMWIPSLNLILLEIASSAFVDKTQRHPCGSFYDSMCVDSVWLHLVSEAVSFPSVLSVGGYHSSSLLLAPSLSGLAARYICPLHLQIHFQKFCYCSIRCS
jgi:hypothetical protein